MIYAYCNTKEKHSLIGQLSQGSIQKLFYTTKECMLQISDQVISLLWFQTEPFSFLTKKKYEKDKTQFFQAEENY